MQTCSGVLDDKPTVPEEHKETKDTQLRVTPWFPGVNSYPTQIADQHTAKSRYQIGNQVIERIDRIWKQQLVIERT